MVNVIATNWENFVLTLKFQEEKQFYANLFEKATKLIEFLFSHYKSNSPSIPLLLIQTSEPTRFPFCNGKSIYISKYTVEFAKLNSKYFSVQGNLIEDDEVGEYFFLWLIAHEFMHCEQNHLLINDANKNSALELDADGYATSGLYRYLAQGNALVSEAAKTKMRIFGSIFYPMRILIEESTLKKQRLLAQRLCFFVAKLAWTDNYNYTNGHPIPEQQAHLEIKMLLNSYNANEQYFIKSIDKKPTFDLIAYLLEFQSHSESVVSELEELADLIKSKSKLKENIYNQHT